MLVSTAAAEHAHAVDAAARPRDPSFFEGQNRLERDLDLLVAAQLMGKPLGGSRAEGWRVLEPSFLVIVRSDAVPLRRSESIVACRPVVRGVVPGSACAR